MWHLPKRKRTTICPLGTRCSNVHRERHVLDRLEKSGRRRHCGSRAREPVTVRKQRRSFACSEVLAGRFCCDHGVATGRLGIRPQDPICHLGSSLVLYIPSWTTRVGQPGPSDLLSRRSTLCDCLRAPPGAAMWRPSTDYSTVQIPYYFWKERPCDTAIRPRPFGLRTVQLVLSKKKQLVLSDLH
jgi:hypothetical protein